MKNNIEITESPPLPFYYNTLCTFTCPGCGGLMTWGAWECVAMCEACIDRAYENYSPGGTYIGSNA